MINFLLVVLAVIMVALAFVGVAVLIINLVVKDVIRRYLGGGR